MGNDELDIKQGVQTEDAKSQLHKACTDVSDTKQEKVTTMEHDNEQKTISLPLSLHIVL